MLYGISQYGLEKALKMVDHLQITKVSKSRVRKEFRIPFRPMKSEMITLFGTEIIKTFVSEIDAFAKIKNRNGSFLFDFNSKINNSINKGVIQLR